MPTASNGKATKSETQRFRVFKMLTKKKEMTGREIAEALGINGIPNFLKDEAIAGRMNQTKYESDTGASTPALYSLTANGVKAYKNGTVDSEAPSSTAGKPAAKKLAKAPKKKAAKKAAKKQSSESLTVVG